MLGKLTSAGKAGEIGGARDGSPRHSKIARIASGEWIAAILKNDTSVLGNLLADGFVSNFDGRTRNKQQVLAEMKSSTAKIESASNSDMRAMVFGDTALVSGLYTEKSTTGGKDTSQQVRYVEVYVKRDGHWRCVTQYLAKV